MIAIATIIFGIYLFTGLILACTSKYGRKCENLSFFQWNFIAWLIIVFWPVYLWIKFMDWVFETIEDINCEVDE